MSSSREKLKQLVVTLLVFVVWVAEPARSHEVRPAFLQVTERPNNRYDILWKRPSQGTTAVHLLPQISGGVLDTVPSTAMAMGDFEIRLWRNVSAGDEGLEGRTLQIEGLDQTITDVLVSIALANGDTVQEVLRPQNLRMTFRLRKTRVAVRAYVTLGIEHILTGMDHLSFVCALTLLVRRRMALIKTLTAFTAAHSITLALTTFRLIAVRPAVVETLVALSVVFVAIEIVHNYRGKTSLTVRHPSLIAFTFGLLHGAAFAGALSEIGLPPDAIPLSLLLFNVGVELGQLLIVTVVFSLGWAFRRMLGQLPDWVRWVPPYAIGSFAASWFLERLATALI